MVKSLAIACGFDYMPRNIRDDAHVLWPLLDDILAAGVPFSSQIERKA